jgi:hypothetical protein
MFPNIRVMIAALLASIAGISCGLGALAAFRVNHQPFTRMQSANPPLQLAFGAGLPETLTDGRPAPFGVRFEVNLRPQVEATISAPSNARPPAAASAVADPQASQEAGLEIKPQPAAATPQGGGEDVGPRPASAAERSEPIESTVPAAADTKPATAEATSADTPPAAKTENTATVEPAATTSPDQGVSAKPNPGPAMAAPAEKAAPRHVAKLHRRRKPQAATAAPAADQNSGSPMSQFQWQGPAQQTSKPRTVAKGHRPVQKAAARATGGEQTASGDAAVAAARR